MVKRSYAPRIAKGPLLDKVINPLDRYEYTDYHQSI